jgi:preprotein translocase subunit SecD
MKLTFRIWLLVIIVALSIFSIFGQTFSFGEAINNPLDPFHKGALVKSVQTNSTAFEAGIRQGQIINSINGEEVVSAEDFTRILLDVYPSTENIKTIFQTNEGEIILYNKDFPNITVGDVEKTSLKFGGSRALIKAEGKDLSAEEVRDLVDITSNRLNEFGLTDLRVVPITDLSGNNFMLIEIAGATPDDLEELVSKQGIFEAKIVNDTVFVGGDKDISSVARTGEGAGIYSCDQDANGHYCSFRFSVFLSENAAKKHAEITDKIEVNSSTQGNYLAEKLDLYLDGKLVDSLLISESLKGVKATQIMISGSGKGESREDAYQNAIDEMHKLQTVLITGSLPFKLEIIKLDTISPALGKDFLHSILLAGIAAILAVALIVFLRYRKVKSSLALILTTISEVIIILGIASFIEWNLDLPSIAGIIAGVGTGIDSQLIVLDEAKQETNLNIKQRLKRAFGIILGAYFTAVVALLPLMWAGAGLLKGFAITTIIGISTGVLITRPAFSDMIRLIEE